MSDIDKELLDKYNKLRLDKRELLRLDRLKQQQLDDIMRSKAWRLVDMARKRKAAIVDPIKDWKNKKRSAQGGEEYALQYHGTYQENETFLDMKTDIKAIAFYLPQFHTFPENDQWWGKGFTEWTNTKSAKPRFPGHYQPRVPHDDFGYYTLDNVDIFKKQIKLAKEHGLYGFSFYYYWFSGKRLMDGPLKIWLEHKELDFPFCICWANENWTRRWDGKEEDVLIKQRYQRDDPKNFIKDIKKILLDSRYIRVDGKPLLMIYNPTEIPDFGTVVEEWRKQARSEGIGELYIISRNSIYSTRSDCVEYVDGEFDFPPNGFDMKHYWHSEIPESYVYDYDNFIINLQETAMYDEFYSPKPFYFAAMMGWDNSPRRKKAGYTVFANYSPEIFYGWMKSIIKRTRELNPADKRFVFVNAWNEWAEGTYLEPDKRYGYNNINVLSRALFDVPLDKDAIIIDEQSPECRAPGNVALQVHVYYDDLLPEVFDALERVPFKFDVYFSTDTPEKKKRILTFLKKRQTKIREAKVEVIENRGRDVYPFVKMISPVYEKYDYIGHIHTKKTVEHAFGDEWRQYLYSQLFGTEDNMAKVFGLFNDSTVGVVYPVVFDKVAHAISVGSNLPKINELLGRMSLPKFEIDDLKFPAGTMFWARKSAIEKIFELGLTAEEFMDEAGQIDGTTAHALERLLGIVPKKSGYGVVQYYSKLV